MLSLISRRLGFARSRPFPKRAKKKRVLRYPTQAVTGAKGLGLSCTVGSRPCTSGSLPSGIENQKPERCLESPIAVKAFVVSDLSPSNKLRPRPKTSCKIRAGNTHDPDMKSHGLTSENPLGSLPGHPCTAGSRTYTLSNHLCHGWEQHPTT